MNLSYCTTCHKRFWQLEKVLEHNIKAVQNDPRIEWVILDYGSNESAAEKIKERVKNIERVRFLQTEEMKYFSAPHAKNMVHCLAKGDILFNLDADNFIEKTNTTRILKLFSNQPNSIVHNWTGSYFDGTYGRLAIKKEHFHLLRGYDESLEGMFFQDSDLITRSKNLGLTYHHLFYLDQRKPIENSEDEKTSYLQHDRFEIHSKNREIFRNNLRQGMVSANREHYARGRIIYPEKFFLEGKGAFFIKEKSWRGWVYQRYENFLFYKKWLRNEFHPWREECIAKILSFYHFFRYHLYHFFRYTLFHSFWYPLYRLVIFRIPHFSKWIILRVIYHRFYRLGLRLACIHLWNLFVLKIAEKIYHKVWLRCKRVLSRIGLASDMNQ